jgi:hypothetical protein
MKRMKRLGEKRISNEEDEKARRNEKGEKRG